MTAKKCTKKLACVASVSVWFRSKEIPRKGLSVLTAREMKRERKKERGGGGREGRKPSFLPHPLPALLLAPFFSGSLILVPRSFLLNRTETFATQATKKRAVRAEMLFCFSLDYYIIIVGFRNVSNKIQ